MNEFGPAPSEAPEAFRQDIPPAEAAHIGATSIAGTEGEIVPVNENVEPGSAEQPQASDEQAAPTPEQATFPGPKIGADLATAIEAGNPHEMHDEYGGKVYLDKVEQRNSLRKFATPQMQTVMAKAGFEYGHDENGNLTEVLNPDPKRLQTATEQNDIPVALITEANNDGRIPGKQFGQAIEQDKKHPVGVDNGEYYTHDITVDHLPAVIVCGDELFTTMQGGLKSSQDIAESYDHFTEETTVALQNLFEGNNDKFERFVTERAPFLINGTVDASTSQNVRAMIYNGLGKLGIPHGASAVEGTELPLAA